MEPDRLKQIVEAALLAADEPLTLDQIAKLFRAGEVDEESIRQDIRDVLKALAIESAGRGYELKRVASGFRFQVRQELSTWISRLWEEKPPRYTRALLETLALIAYRQPVTRGDIEQVRGVSVSQNIMRTLLERGWIRVVGQREVPGKPAMYGTTRAFLDYFNLKSLDQLPPLAEIRALIEPLVVEEALPEPATAQADAAAGIAAKIEVADESEPAAAHAEAQPESAELVVAEPEPATPGAEMETPEAETVGSDVAAAEASEEDAADERPRVVEVVTGLDSPEPDTEDADDSGLPTAEVVRLPTSPQ